MLCGGWGAEDEWIAIFGSASAVATFKLIRFENTIWKQHNTWSCYSKQMAWIHQLNALTSAMTLLWCCWYYMVVFQNTLLDTIKSSVHNGKGKHSSVLALEHSLSLMLSFTDYCTRASLCHDEPWTKTSLYNYTYRLTDWKLDPTETSGEQTILGSCWKRRLTQICQQYIVVVSIAKGICWRTSHWQHAVWQD